MTCQVFKSEVFSSRNVAYGFFGRSGGVSTGVFDSLNCGVGNSDNPAHVVENRARVAAELGVEAGALIGLYQTHSAVCHRVEAVWDARPEGDAFVTDVPGIALGVLTADCGPVLLMAEKSDGSPIIGAAHAGWKGALGGVLGATVEAMCAYDGVEPEKIRAAIGPCIAQKSYEVSADFADAFLAEDDVYERFFAPARDEGKLMFDLSGFCAARLAEAGVRQVSMMDMDTYGLERDFFSYRRATHRGEEDYGRQISAIAIR